MRELAERLLRDLYEGGINVSEALFTLLVLGQGRFSTKSTGLLSGKGTVKRTETGAYSKNLQLNEQIFEHMHTFQFNINAEAVIFLFGCTPYNT